MKKEASRTNKAKKSGNWSVESNKRLGLWLEYKVTKSGEYGVQVNL